MGGSQRRPGEATYEKVRILFAGLTFSPPFFAALMWLAVGRNASAAVPVVAVRAVWGVVALGGLVVWLGFRSKAVEPMNEWPRHRRRAEGFDTSVLQSRLIVAWGGAEAVGFAGVVVYFFLGGSLAMLVSSLTVSLSCLALAAPRKTWYRELEREDAAEVG